MLFKNIGLVDENFAYREGMYVGTIGDRIAYIGETEPGEEAPAPYAAASSGVAEARGKKADLLAELISKGEAHDIDTDKVFDYTVSADPRSAGETGACCGRSYAAGEMHPVYGEVYDGTGKILMPAFYNAHGHSPMCLMRGYGENLPLDRWLNEKIFPFEDKLYSDAVYWSTLLTMAESMQFGIVSTSDMYYFTDDMVRAIAVSEYLKVGRKPRLRAPRGLRRIQGDARFHIHVRRIR